MTTCWVGISRPGSTRPAGAHPPAPIRCRPPWRSMPRRPRATTGPRRTYVLDTSVLLADPTSLRRFDEHDVVLPVVVLSELESKRHHPDLGWAAREALRTLEALGVEYGSVVQPSPVNDEGGTPRVELNPQDPSSLPAALTSDNNDHRILAVAK